jgi:hypothetical protein
VPEATLSVKDLVGIPEEGIPGVLSAGISDEELKSLRTKITGALPGMEWSRVESAVSRKLAAILDDVEPMTLFAASWEKYRLLSDAAEKSKTRDMVLAPMEEHSVSTKLHPYIEIQVGPMVLPPIEFDVILSLTLKSVVVRVESAEIRGIEAGTVEGSAKVEVKGHSIWTYNIEPISLPGKIRLREGIPIH